MPNQAPPPPIKEKSSNQYNSDFISSSQDNVFSSSDHNQKVTSVRLKKSFGSIFIIFSILTLLISIAGSGYFFWTNSQLNKDLNDLTKQKTSLEADYNSTKNQKILSESDSVINRASLLEQMINRRVDWKKVLEIINIESYRNVKYTSITVGDDKTLTLAGECPDEFTFSKMYRTWEQSKYIDQLIPGSYEQHEADAENNQEAYVSFSLSAKLNDKIFNSDNLLDSSDLNTSATPTTATSQNTTSPSN